MKEATPPAAAPAPAKKKLRLQQVVVTPVWIEDDGEALGQMHSPQRRDGAPAPLVFSAADWPKAIERIEAMRVEREKALNEPPPEDLHVEIPVPPKEKTDANAAPAVPAADPAGGAGGAPGRRTRQDPGRARPGRRPR